MLHCEQRVRVPRDDRTPPRRDHAGACNGRHYVEFATTGWTSLANVTGWAAISLPLGSTDDGLPIGVQLMAPDETVLLQLAAQLEAVAPWADPPAWVRTA